MALACQLCVSVREGFRKRTIDSARLDARHFSFCLYATGAFQAVPSVLDFRGVESEQVSSCVGSLRGPAWGSSSFFHQHKPHWFLQPEVVGTYLPVIGTIVWEAWCGTETPHSQDIPPEFLSTTCRCGTRTFHGSASTPLLPVWMDVISLILQLSDFHLTLFLMVLSDGCSIF